MTTLQFYDELELEYNGTRCFLVFAASRDFAERNLADVVFLFTLAAAGVAS